MSNSPEEFLHSGSNEIFTLRAQLSGAVYSVLPACLWLHLCVCLWVCYHDNSKLRVSIFTKLGL